MKTQLSWKVGGQQGEGIESTGEIFSMALNRLGYYLYGYRHFSSRIKGGHTNNKIRVSTEKIRSITDDLDILVAFDQETIDVNASELHEQGYILADSKFTPTKSDDVKATLFAIPFSEIAKELGNPLMKNMVAIGATASLLQLDIESFRAVVQDIFGRKGEYVVNQNMEAIEKGVASLQAQLPFSHTSMKLAKADGNTRMFMIGNDAIALGFLAGGCRFMAAYPITPASEIMEYLIKKLPEFGGTVIQTEDEIAAATMAIGANYGGVRTITASAGPGLSLMMESIGLAGMTETPLVIVDTQRGGPSTGLPTKQEQSDLVAMIYGTHGEIPKVVIAPSTVEEAFHDAVEALNVADEYQCPVILLSDLQLSLGKQTVDPLDYRTITIRRGKIDNKRQVEEQDSKENIKRYQVTPDGISPRVFPGTKNGIFHVTGVEHNEYGKPSESASNRKEQMDKRLRKLIHLPDTFPTPIYMNQTCDEADLLLIGFNSTRGALEEVQHQLQQDGYSVNHAQIRLIHPFPTTHLLPLLKTAKKVMVVEHNATGQLASIIKMNAGFHEKIESITSYDGTPFLPRALYHACKELL
ncbi:2-oxoacid:acceptor oxidoreductase subunit alpha [Pontibacillus yanchengensis]|uniref:2-oxoacid:acceptor oxidoreductase subunit alpha n=2 Tax=Pontibacillus yanchengensis TaxID=462910 RepID=A0ACC7VCP5_9BACI|nr:2-oxoacid:acceptor oxidoreductase subunit alpha [Pontibacillus yanchengensis]MYL33221.1 2-oxoacid:acceptor oxidoreductase subunit alpha [Pontibacillus yanchengensis]MYL51929.1 2-oxoacid:acceptor oxidoreductase subunit alpha [Pontibacillus yanchengensis]